MPDTQSITVNELKPKKTNLLGFSRETLHNYFSNLGEKPFRANQLMQWIHQRGITDFDEMTNISKQLRSKLKDIACVELAELKVLQKSSDGTRKWLISVSGVENSIESVLIPEKGRNTLCISSQVGCTLNCSFCSTARQGFNRNLTSAEIISQLFMAHHTLRKEGIENGVTNVVFMGMGEPLLNFDAVIEAIKIMGDDFSYGLSKRRITLSTAGVVPAIYKLAEHTDVSLAISLHASNDALREKLVPINKKYPIHQLLDACRQYVADGLRRRITFEYVMLKGVNDSLEDAKQLVKLLRDVPSKLNLIPFNPFPDAGYERSTNKDIDTFREYVMSKGIITVTRRPRGDDIDAACGQLVGKVKDRSRRSMKMAKQQTSEVA
ncbi:MAG: 23S rRNA (adenine(2503)-C(2))-methyltransferase RlmN [Gammaproteobacteria bacterium]|nr:23S rRNA (adenine(2503)-C(2))-methyltransferase RlmN [Gammaproteobacteria bacterium]